MLSSIVWAAMMIVASVVLKESYKEVSLLLISGYLIEFLLISSSKNALKKVEQEKVAK